MKQFSRLGSRSGSLGLLLFVASAVIASAVWASVPANAPTTHPAVPQGWAAGLDKEIAGVKPLLLNLWDKLPPGYVENAPAERDDGTGRIWNVNIPGILVYLPPEDKRKGVAIVECMGGSYTHLTRLVGADNTCELFVSKGVTVISLKYRLKPPSKDVESDALADGKCAVRLVREHAKEWGIDPHKVGMLGWSAGANLVLNQATHFDGGNATAKDLVERQSSRPDFAVMLSPWPSMHDISAYPAAKDPPPALIGSARDDRTAPFAFAKAIEGEWQKAGAKYQFIEAQTGGHASFELGSGNEGATWPEKFFPWLESIGVWKP